MLTDKGILLKRTKRYGDKLALDHVTLNIEQNTIYGLLGRNGAGKTTLMSILTAQNFATSGEVTALLLIGVRALLAQLGVLDQAFGVMAGLGAAGMALWGLLVIAILMTVSFLLLRRATP